MRRSGGYCRTCVKEYNRRYFAGEDNKAHLQERICEQCGERYIPKHGKARLAYCSRSCKDTAKNAAAAKIRVESKPIGRICMHCGGELPQRMRVDAIFCSKECNYRANALQRKLRARTGEEGKPGYLRAFICNRDSWCCGICHKAVSRTKQHPDPLCASLDHVIPVSEGGTNDVWNLRLTHLKCNLRRRNAGGGEQLAFL
jgi:hypothetical protein